MRVGLRWAGEATAVPRIGLESRSVPGWPLPPPFPPPCWRCTSNSLLFFLFPGLINSIGYILQSVFWFMSWLPEKHLFFPYDAELVEVKLGTLAGNASILLSFSRRVSILKFASTLVCQYQSVGLQVMVEGSSFSGFLTEECGWYNLVDEKSFNINIGHKHNM